LIKLIYDISTQDLAYNTLKNLLRSTDDYIEYFIQKVKMVYSRDIHMSNLDICQKMIEILRIDLDIIDLAYLQIAFTHITTSNNGCIDIKNNGLMGLDQVIMSENEVTNFLHTYDVYIDVKHEIIETNRGICSITPIYDNVSDERKKYSHLGTKIYNDFSICGFYYYSLTHPYGGRVHKRPEILNEISRVVNGVDLSREWENTFKKTYAIKSIVPMDKVDTYFIGSYENDTNYNFKIGLLNRALYKIYADTNMQNENCILKKNVSVLPSEIIEIKQIVIEN